MTNGADPAWLALGVAGVAAGSATALLGASWWRQRRVHGSDRERVRRIPPAPDAEDPMLASLQLPRDRRERPER